MQNVKTKPDLKDVNDGQVTSHNSSHPVGTTLGTVGGAAAGVAGAVVSGAAVGAAVGPAGAAIGAAVGGVVGAMTGHEIAAQINPKEEDLYWRANYSTRPYIKSGTDYEIYRPAYRYGVESYSRYPDRSFDEIESDLESKWDSARGDSDLEWKDAKYASRDAYDRLNHTNV